MAADNDFIIHLELDVRDAVGSAQKLANAIATLNSEFNDKSLNNAERNLAKFNGTQKQTVQSLSTTRFALQNVSNTLLLVGTALVGLSVLPAKVAIEFQRSFANVARTVQGAGAGIENSLISLSTQLPLAFSDLSDIAALGGQLGIGKSGIVDFTKTVAELTATTNLTSEAAGTALGRFKALLGVPSFQFENLASSILKVGVNSVATESQIVGIATQIAGIAKVAGLTAPQVVGLAGALASVGAAPELSRGTITRLFTDIQKAVTSGGASLEEFAKVSGVSVDKFRSSFGTAGFSGVLTKFVAGLSDTTRNGGDAIKTLNDLGISSVRDVPLLLRLSQATGLLAKSQRDAASGFASTSTLTTQYGRIANTAASQVTILQNSFKAFLASLGAGTTGPIKDAAVGLTNFLNNIRAIISNPISATVAGVALAFVGLVGVLALFGAVAARGAASVIGLIQALRGMNAEGAGSIGILATLNSELAATGTVGTIASKGIGLVVKSLGLFAAIAAALLVTNLAGGFFGNLITDSITAKIKIDDLKGSSEKALKTISKFINASDIQGLGGTGTNSSTVRGNINSSNTSTQSNKIADLVNQLNNKQGSVASFIDGLSGGFAGKASGQTEAIKSIGTLDKAFAALVKGGNVSQAQQLVDKFRLTAIAGGADTKDLSSFLPLYNKAMKEAAAATTAATAANEKLNASQGLSINITKTLDDLTGLNAKGQAKFATAYAQSVSSLTDFNSVVGQVQTALGAANKNYDGSTVSLSQFTKQLQSNNTAQQTWISNLIQVSSKYGQDAANIFIQAGYTATNASILQQLTDATPAQAQAYIDAQEQAAQLASQATANALLASGYIVTASGAAIGQDTANALAKGLSLGLPVEYLMGQLGLRFANAPQPVVTPYVNTDQAQRQLDTFITKNGNRTINIVGTALPSQARANGGPIYGPGSGTSDSISARLSNGEYVIRAASVRKYGMGMFDSLNRGVARFAKGGPVRGYASGGPVAAASGMGVTELGPRSLGVLRDIVAKEMSVYVGDIPIAQAARRGNAQLTGMGAQ